MDSPYSSMNRDNLLARIDNLESQLAVAMTRNRQLNENIASVQARCTELLERCRAHAEVLTLDAYQKASARTLNSALSSDKALCNYGLGLAGEAGEVVEPIKKYLFHGKPLDHQHLTKELGDCIWYIAAIASTLGLSLGDIAQANIDKLKARWPGKFGEV